MEFHRGARLFVFLLTFISVYLLYMFFLLTADS